MLQWHATDIESRDLLQWHTIDIVSRDLLPWHTIYIVSCDDWFTNEGVTRIELFLKQFPL